MVMMSSTPPVVTIVGRPNVGKSTLFNCLTQSRQALVADQAGVTRDRQYGQAYYETQPFIVIDTGGLVTQGDYLQDLTLHQAQQALSEADHILFVVAANEGVTSEDQAILNVLRHYNKPICLVVNKMDGVNQIEAEAEFSVFGLSIICYTATAHRRGIHTLKETLFAGQFTFGAEGAGIEVEQDEGLDLHDLKTAAIQLSVIGHPNVGKSTFVNRVLGESRLIVSELAGTTRDSIYIPLNRYGRDYVLVDTAGMRRRHKVREVVEKFSMIKSLQAIATSHVCLVMINATESVIAEQDLRLLRFVLEAGKGLIIAVNKWDCIPTDERADLKADFLYRLKFVDFADVHFISAKAGRGIKPIFSSVSRAYYSAMNPLSTPKLTRLLEEAVNAHPPPLSQGRRIKLRYAHPGGRNPPCIIIHGKQVQQLSPTYQRYLISFFRNRLKLVGTPIRLVLKNNKNPYAK